MPQTLRDAMKLVLMFLILLSTPAVFADDRVFHCVINNIYNLNSKGELEKETGGSVPKVNDRFFVHRTTGLVIGERVPVFRPDRFNLLAPGTDGNAFVSSYSGRTRIGFLRIENFRNEAQSPFLLSDGIWVATGICN